MTTKTPPKSTVVMFGDKPARNVHFKLTLDSLNRAEPRLAEEGYALADVLRAAIIDYGSATKRGSATSDDGVPSTLVRGMRTVFKNGDRGLINGYMAALSREGWSRQVLADAVVKAGLAQTMTRQAVSLRVLAAEKEAKEHGGLLPDGLPAVPHPGLRRPYPTTKSPVALDERPGREVSVRVLETDYHKANARAKAEHAKMVVVVEDYLERYADGKFSVSGIPARKAGAQRRVAKTAPDRARAAASRKVAAATAAAKKAAAKKAPATKTAAKKAPATKTTAKKAPAAKAPAKKTAAKRAPAKKTARA